MVMLSGQDFRACIHHALRWEMPASLCIKVVVELLAQLMNTSLWNLVPASSVGALFAPDRARFLNLPHDLPATGVQGLAASWLETYHSLIRILWVQHCW